MAKKSTLETPTLLDHTTGLTALGTCLVAGLSWKPVLGQDPEKLAIQEAKKAGATHYAQSGKSSNVGLAKLPKNDGTRYISLAGLFASSNPASSVFLALILNQGKDQIWVCGVSNGSVLTGFDTVVTGVDAARDLLNAFARRFPEANTWGDAQELELEPVYTWQSLSETLANEPQIKAATLKVAAKGTSLTLKSIPRPVVYLAILVILFLGFQKIVLPGLKAMNPFKQKVVVEDPQTVWQQAIDDTLSKVKLSSPKTLPDLIVDLIEQPNDVGGWRTKTTTCKWSPKAWTCDASFLPSSRTATNATFESARPKDWKTSWDLLKGVTATYSVPASSMPLNVAKLKTRIEHEITTGSKIQSLKYLMSQGISPMNKFTQIVVPAPKSEKGEPIAMPDGMFIPLVSEVAINAPVRSASAFGDLADLISWESAVFTFDAQQTPGIDSSVLMMTIKGKIYAKP